MALLTFTDVPLNHPTETNENGIALVFTMRLPLAAGALEKINPDSAGNNAAIHLDMLSAALVAWPYDDPITAESIRRLDLDTFNWLVAEMKDASNITDDEKNASSSNSEAITAPDAEPSPENSATSKS